MKKSQRQYTNLSYNTAGAFQLEVAIVCQQRIEALCRSFLIDYFGDGPNAWNNANRIRGLRLVCLSMEKPIQAELLRYLRNNEVNAVVEVAAHNEVNLSFVDIVAFSESWEPICVIELKHRGANQGPVTALLAGLEQDRLEHQNMGLNHLPLIQIGLYTEVANGFPNGNRPPYRYSIYCHGAPNNTVENQQANIPANFGAQMMVPPYVVFPLALAENVTGRVGWILRIV